MEAFPFLGRKYSLLIDVKEFSSIIIFIDSFISALPILLSKATDARTIFHLEESDCRSDQVTPIVEIFEHPAMD